MIRAAVKDHFRTCRRTCAGALLGCGIILAVLLALATTARIEHALQNRRLPDWRLVLRRLFHGRRMGDRWVARRTDLLRDLNASDA